MRIVRDTCGLAAALNQAAGIARGKFLVFLDAATQVQPGWLDALIDTFSVHTRAGLVGSRLLAADGRLLEAGRRRDRDGATRAIGHGEDPGRPEYSHVRPVDACSIASLAVRRDLFIALEGFASGIAGSDHATGDGGVAPMTDPAGDLASRVERAGFLVYCQPFSEVVLCRGDAAWESAETPGYPALAMRRSPPVDPRSGCGEELGRMGAATLDRPAPQRALVVDYAIPAPDLDSGSLRMVNLLAILRDLGYAVTFVATGLMQREPYSSDLQRQGIEVLYPPYVGSVEAHLRSRGARYQLVVLSRAETASLLLPLARRSCPRARILYDTVDLHFQRLAREAALHQDRRTARLARRMERLETAAAAKADVTLVVSATEKGLLEALVPRARVQVVSNIHRVHPSSRPFEERADILFIGGFAHPPNRDAVLFFCADVLPLLADGLPAARFIVIGSDPPPEVVRLASDKVRILGHVPDVDPYLEGCRLSVAPLRFGAGVKGKINQSLARGLPVVATPLAAEGMFLVDGESALIAADTEGFAAATLRLYRDAALWYRLSRGGLAVMQEHFSFEAARKAVTDVLAR